MRILILGATGLLGHRLMIELSKHHEVFGTVRGEIIPSFADSAHIAPMVHCDDVLSYVSTAQIVRPSVVINCIAAIPQRNPDIHEMLIANAQFPHYLADICKVQNARLIHFSTDAVFSGKRGNYTEDDTPDATDTYGMTKRLGEIGDMEHVLTLRCCPIGRELPLSAKHSLVEWFLAQTGEVKGYTKAMLTPMTTHNIASVLDKSILEKSSLHGLYHLSGAPMSKYDLLVWLKDQYQHNVEIIPDDSVVINRTLNGMRLRERIDYGWSIYDITADNALYEKVAI